MPPRYPWELPPEDDDPESAKRASEPGQSRRLTGQTDSPAEQTASSATQADPPTDQPDAPDPEVTLPGYRLSRPASRPDSSPSSDQTVRPRPARQPRSLDSTAIDPQQTRRQVIPPQYESQRRTRRGAPPTRPSQRWPQRPKRRINWLRLLVRTMLTLLLLLILGAVLAAAGSVITYAYIAGQLPPAEELKRRQFQFRTTTIYDRNGHLLWEINDPSFGRRMDIPLTDVATDMRNATIATEDRNFYLNIGVDPIAIGRAVYYNLNEGSIVSGASTITQQLAKNVLLAPEERIERSLSRKVREAVLAVEISRQYSKNDILEIYLNQIYYGNLAYGVEAASQTYFGKPASQLTLAESALLAGLPQSPAVYDPYSNPEGAKRRQEVVLGLMVEAGYITPAEANAAAREPILDHLHVSDTQLAAPHFVNLVWAELETLYPADLIYQAGLRVETTLDRRLQDIAAEEVRNQVNSLADRNITNGALVAIDVESGQILALVGSKDFQDDAIAGQVNMAVAPRQPGSTIKPLVYLAAFERGWTPSTLLMDVPVEYPDGAGGTYKPHNYDEKFHGPVSLRIALANSYNIPAVKALEFVGLNDFKQFAARLGITTLTRDDYGLALALGAGEIPLVEMTGAFQAMANQGEQIKPYAVLRLVDHQGNEVPLARPPARRVLQEEHAYLITNILADNQARSRSFGPNSQLNLSRPAAAKTGTTNDYRDNLVIGYTPDIVTGVWVGNADYTPMQGTTGMSGAGPIWHNFMERAHEGLPVRDFVRPPGIVSIEVCADSGTIPSDVCPERRIEIFASAQPPLGSEYDIHQLIDIDLNTGLRANEFCRTNVETRYYRVFPPDGRDWALAQGIAQPPDEYCPSSAIDARITFPVDGETVRGTISVEGRALAANFAYYDLEYGVGTGPQAFGKLLERETTSVEGGPLYTFDTTQLDNGPYTLRLVVYDQTGGSLESRVRVLIDNLATPTPLPSATDTPFPTNTPQAVVEPTGAPTEPIPAPPETPTATPTVIPTETATPPLTATAIVTATEPPPVTVISIPTETPISPAEPEKTPTETATLPVELVPIGTSTPDPTEATPTPLG